MKIYEIGAASAGNVLIQAVDEHDYSLLEQECVSIREQTDVPFMMRAFLVEDWNRDLSPWEAPAVFGNAGFGNGAQDTLKAILDTCGDCEKTYFLGGYSLSGLFALWAGCVTDRFQGIAAASPSGWFPGFVDYLKAHPMLGKAVYLSLGDREEKTRNPVMSMVGNCIRTCRDILDAQSIPTELVWNQGNHFRDADKRTAHGFAWVLRRAAYGAS